MKPTKELPTPEMLLVEARGVIERDAPIDLSEYAPVIGQLRDKNYSFGRISEWLGERLGRPINKGGVFRVYQDWLESQNDNPPDQEAFEPPPGDQEEAERVIQQVADEILDAANEVATRKLLPAWFASEGILRAARTIEREQADERAADTSDALKSNNQATEKS